MGTTTFRPDPTRLLRTASALRETGAAMRRLSPEAADDLEMGADTLMVVVATLGLVLPAPAPEPRRRVHLVTGAQQAAAAARADEWLQVFLRDVLPEDGGMLPSNRAIFKAAAHTDGLDLPRRVIERAIWRRWPEREGAPIK